jgi:glycosyltransferase involved in cell wall biosynthesis
MQIGVVVPDLRHPGGITQEAVVIARSLRSELAADVRIVSLATSSSDDSSRLLRHPSTWTRRPAAASYQHEEFTVDHVGAFAAEVELARYRPRRALLERIAGCDVLHVIGGTPAWAQPVRGFQGPLILHFASFARHERTDTSGWRSPLGAWRRLMTTGVTAIEKTALRRADVIIAMNDTRRREAEAIVGGTRPVMTVHTGVDTRHFRPDSYRSDGYLLTVGRLSDPRKNLALLLRAYAAARRQSTAVPPLVLVGHHPPTPVHWRLVAQLGLESSVEYRGAVSREDLPETYRRASAFVLSSDEEGLGIVVLEAMASGLPVIATSCIGPTETVTDGAEGFLVPVGSVAPLADAIVRVSSDEALRRRLSSGARRRAVEEFSLEKAARRLGDADRAAGLTEDSPAGAASVGRLVGGPVRRRSGGNRVAVT